MWYKVDFDKLILLLLPTFLRKPVLYGYIRAMIDPIADLHYKWSLTVRDQNIKKLEYNCQRCYLRGALNDDFDNDERRITISDTQNLEQDYIYTQAENLDVYLGTMFLEQDFNYAGTVVDYIVNVPAAFLDAKINKITALIEFYNLAGKQYKIIPI